MFLIFLTMLRRWSRRGMFWPFVHDPVANKPSVTLMFFYISFVLANLAISVSTIMMLFGGETLKATFMPTILLVLGFVFYRLRSLDHVKIDLDDQEIELSSDDDEVREENE